MNPSNATQHTWGPKCTGKAQRRRLQDRVGSEAGDTMGLRARPERVLSTPANRRREGRGRRSRGR